MKGVETVYLAHPGDMGVVGKRFVIPLPRHRALRIGGYVRFGISIGPRRYRVVMTERAVRDLAEITNTSPEWVKNNWPGRGVEFETAAPSPEQPGKTL